MKTTDGECRDMLGMVEYCLGHGGLGVWNDPPMAKLACIIVDALEAHRLRRELEALQAREREVGYPMMISMDTIDRILDGPK